MQRINLKRLKNAVYFIPFKEPVPSQDEVNSFKKFWSLIRRFKVKANYFMATHVEPQNLVQTDTSKNGRRDPSRMKRYFALKPIKIPLE